MGDLKDRLHRPWRDQTTRPTSPPPTPEPGPEPGPEPSPWSCTKIVSFGFKHGKPDVGGVMHGPGGRIVDVRDFANPYHDASLRPLSGTDPHVKVYILEQTTNFVAKYQDLYRALERGPQVLWVGCTGGRHRSVYLADRLGAETGIPVEHRDLDKKEGA